MPPPPASLLDGNASLFLDFDGTLVAIAETPEAVMVDARLRDLLASLHARLNGRVVLISGRPAEQLAQLLDLPALDIVGSHGMEFRHADGRRASADRPAALGAAFERIRRHAERHPGLRIEEKPLGVALHYRQAPEEAGSCETLARELAAEHGLHFQPGKMMVEVRAAGGDKGAAIRALMAEPRMVSTRPLFMGDDLTDEPGFIAAGELGGAGILIGSPRPSAARYRLDDVAAVRDWLAAGSAA
ncbi:trehalose-phosphatase [Sphingomonas naasensis]|uniref:Trehalose 6-phosphate phosphatase n=1 Tax=Sphingomonas naasensis TaxID=1344951 RepID=A0A4S1WTY6_9SPHN|nr:trehalose-phosphatase [Sphingomonas naasensis]TGX46563.1 trehalose-phosphatase [Sphingomonas naasensis]